MEFLDWKSTKNFRSVNAVRLQNRLQGLLRAKHLEIYYRGKKNKLKIFVGMDEFNKSFHRSCLCLRFVLFQPEIKALFFKGSNSMFLATPWLSTIVYNISVHHCVKTANVFLTSLA